MSLKKKKLYIILVGINLFFLFTPVRALTKTKEIYATADAWVDSASPSTNHGTDLELTVGWEPAHWKQTLIRFNVSTRPIRYSRVELQFYCTMVDVLPLDIEIDELIIFEWNESTVTWDNGPDLFDGWAIAYSTISNTGINKITLDPTFVFDNYSIWIFPVDTYSIKIASRENSLMSPRIVFFYEVSDLPIIINVIVIISLVSITGILGYFIYRRIKRKNQNV